MSLCGFGSGNEHHGLRPQRCLQQAIELSDSFFQLHAELRYGGSIGNATPMALDQSRSASCTSRCHMACVFKNAVISSLVLAAAHCSFLCGWFSIAFLIILRSFMPGAGRERLGDNIDGRMPRCLCWCCNATWGCTTGGDASTEAPTAAAATPGVARIARLLLHLDEDSMILSFDF